MNRYIIISAMIVVSIFILACSPKTIAPSTTTDRSSSPLEAPAQADTNDMSIVYINNCKISLEQVQELKQVYGKPPVPGNYWYDTISGLQGKIGEPASGYISPGHKFCLLPADASNGDTGILINNRELPEIEVKYLEALLQVERQEGEYWLDANGNLGIRDNSWPLVNLYMAALQAQNSGDNYWASNSVNAYGNEQNGFGYVTVDGTSVTYGG